MKKSLTIATFAVIAVACATTIHAATSIHATNSRGGDFTHQVVLPDGTPFVNGTVMIGTFTTTPDNGPIPSDMWEWKEFGSVAFSSNAIAPGVFGAFGGHGVTGELPMTPSGPFVGNSIYAMVANPDASDFIIWKSGLSFQVEYELLGGAPLSFLTNQAELVRGIVLQGGNKGLGGPLAGFNGQDAITFITNSSTNIVPEPSVAMLGALGILALFRRRR